MTGTAAAKLLIKTSENITTPTSLVEVTSVT